MFTSRAVGCCKKIGMGCRIEKEQDARAVALMRRDESKKQDVLLSNANNGSPDPQPAPNWQLAKNINIWPDGQNILFHMSSLFVLLFTNALYWKVK